MSEFCGRVGTSATGVGTAARRKRDSLECCVAGADCGGCASSRALGRVVPELALELSIAARSCGAGCMRRPWRPPDEEAGQAADAADSDVGERVRVPTAHRSVACWRLHRGDRARPDARRGDGSAAESG